MTKRLEPEDGGDGGGAGGVLKIARRLRLLREGGEFADGAGTGAGDENI